MPHGVLAHVENGYARLSFTNKRTQGESLAALLKTGAPIDVRTGGSTKEYIVPEGNAREAGLLDDPTLIPEKPITFEPDPVATQPVPEFVETLVTAGPVTAAPPNSTVPGTVVNTAAPANPLPLPVVPPAAQKQPAAQKAVPAKKAPAKKAGAPPAMKEASDGGTQAVGG